MSPKINKKQITSLKKKKSRPDNHIPPQYTSKNKNCTKSRTKGGCNKSGNIRTSASFSVKNKLKDTSLLKSSEDSESDEYMENETSDMNGNASWADSITKILNMNKSLQNKNLVLSKAKKINQEAKSLNGNLHDFELHGQSTETFANELKPKERNKRTKVFQEIRTKPENYENEKMLKKVATQAVVKFLNAVQIQQRQIEIELDKAGPLDAKRSAVYNNIDKKEFLQLLKMKKSTKLETGMFSNKECDEQAGPSTKTDTKGWGVLRSDFMTNRKIQNWDQEDQ